MAQYLPLLKIPLIFLDASTLWITARAPNPSLPKNQHIIPDWREQFIKFLRIPCLYLRICYWITLSMETTVLILHSLCPTNDISNFIQTYIMQDPSRVVSIRITPTYLFGIFLCTCGALIRIWCYRTLGKLFTFELAIMNDHRLVVEGPYAYARHPSYTGMILTVLGGWIVHLPENSGSWLVASGVREAPVGWVISQAAVGVGVLLILGLVVRIPMEDDILRREFEIKWEMWVKKVPYALVPWVY